jgi:two-component system OmpR family response regulator
MLKILLVDDEQDFLRIMEARIKSWGYELVKAVNGSEALKAAEDEKPDAIILDYMLPDMDGIAVLKKIRERDKGIPVIMLTANPDEKSIKGADSLGISAYIPKLSMFTDVQLSLKGVLKIIEDKKKK